MSYLGVPPFGQTVRTVTEVVATAGQTTFAPSGGYLPGYIDVYLNGVSLSDSDFTASDGVVVVLQAAASAADEFKAVAYWPVSLVDTYRKAESDARYMSIDEEALPDQTGQAGKYLKTDGTDASWEEITAPSPGAVSDQVNPSTGYFSIPIGTTANRPASPANGSLRMNTTLGMPEWYDTYGASWRQFYQPGATPYTVEFLVVAGGGGAAWRGNRNGGGGGAGGYRNSVPGELSGRSSSAESVLPVTPSVQYTVTIGAGGAAASVEGNGANGGNSVFGSITSLGGGGGGSWVGVAGGSGGGGSNGDAGGAGTAGQGWNGGPSAGNGYGGGGGGAGENGGTDGGGSGGDGLASAINGTSTYRAGGGAGGGGYAGGDGGGGSSNGGAGVANTGGGGAGTYSAQGGAGGSGIVIIRYLGSQRGVGGTVTSANGYTIHTFTSSGIFTA